MSLAAALGLHRAAFTLVRGCLSLATGNCKQMRTVLYHERDHAPSLIPLAGWACLGWAGPARLALLLADPLLLICGLPPLVTQSRTYKSSLRSTAPP